MKNYSDMTAEAYQKGYQDGYNGITKDQSLSRRNVKGNDLMGYYEAGYNDGQIDCANDKDNS